MRGALLGLVLAALTGCGTESRYHWGSYQGLLFRMYDAPNEAPPERQIERLSADIQEARAKGKPVPPGVYAHRGFMQLKAGHGDDALSDFRMEKQLYPESTKMIDRMIAGMMGRPAKEATAR